MALPTNIQNILNPMVVESSRLEFKENWNPESIIHTICAFANDIDNVSGGYIIIGIKEKNGKPVFPISGLSINEIDYIQKEIIEYCNKSIEPRYIPNIEVVELDGKKIIVLWVPSGSERPYKCKVNTYVKGDNAKAYYIRKGSTTIKANPNDEKELFLLSGLQPFDDRPNYKANLEDLNITLIRSYLKEINSDLYEISNSRNLDQLAQDMNISEGPIENRKPKNVGLMFFTYNPEKFFPYAYIELTNMPDPTGEGMEEIYFKGPLNIQYKDCMTYIKNNVIKEKVFKIPGEMEARRVFNYRYEVLDEIIGNAILHKNYQIHEPISIKIKKESIEITSIPSIDSSIPIVDIKQLKLRSTKYRNRRIAEFLKELHIVEAKNTGYPTIIKYSKLNNSSLPIIKTDDERSYVTVIIPINKEFTIQKRKIKTEEKINNALKENNMKLSELSKVLGYKSIPGSLKRTLEKMLSEGTIELIDKKYRLKNK